MKRFNINELMWFLILLGFSILLYYLLSTGNINTFIHPKMLKYVKGSFVGFIILSINQLPKIFTFRGRSKVSIKYILFFSVLILGFSVATVGLNSSIVSSKGVDLNVAPINTQNDSELDNQGNEVEYDFNNDFTKDEIINIQDDNYIKALNYISGNTESLKGKKVVIEGFVFRDSTFKDDEFVVARLNMVCCAADTQVVGLLSNYDNVNSLKEEQWVRVEGTITSTENKDEISGVKTIIPMINVTKVELISKPENPYIYP